MKRHKWWQKWMIVHVIAPSLYRFPGWRATFAEQYEEMASRKEGTS